MNFKEFNSTYFELNSLKNILLSFADVAADMVRAKKSNAMWCMNASHGARKCVPARVCACVCVLSVCVCVYVRVIVVSEISTLFKVYVISLSIHTLYTRRIS